MAAIGGAGGMDAIGAMLARGSPQGQGGAPPGNGNGAPPGQSPNGQQQPNAGQVADAQLQPIMAAMQRIRDLGEATKQLALEFPMTADVMMQIQQLLKSAVVQMAGPAPMQTGSGAAVPGAGAPMM